MARSKAAAGRTVGGPAPMGSPGGLGWWRTFRGLLRFELLRLRHSRGFWGWVVALGLLMLVGTQTGTAGFGSSNTAIFVMSISIPLLCANDLDAGALKNILVGRHGRSAYVAAMMTAAVGLILALVALWWAVMALRAWVGWQFEGTLQVPRDPLCWVAALIICTLSVVSPALFVAILTRSQPLATIVALLLAGNVPAILLATWVQDAGFAGFSNLIWDASPAQAVAALSSGGAPAMPALIAALVMTALFFALSLWAMARRDVSVCDG